MSELDVLMFKHDELSRKKDYSPSDIDAEYQWLRSSLASVIVWTGEMAQPTPFLADLPSLSDPLRTEMKGYERGFNDSLNQYHKVLLALAEKIGEGKV